MSETTAVDALATEIRQRLDAIDEKVTEGVSDARLAEMVRQAMPSVIDELAADPSSPVIRKLRFGADDKPLAGSKYARLGLGVADIEFLHSILTSSRAAGIGSGPSEALTQAFADVSEGRYVDPGIARFDDLRRLDDLRRSGVLDRDGYERAVRAMDTAESGFGNQLVGAQYVGELWQAPRRLGRVFPLIATFEMTDPTAYLPVEAAPPEMLFVSESTANNSSNYSTSKTGSNRVQVDAKKFVIHQMWSGEMEEDSIIPFLAFIRMEAANSVAHYSDSLVLNGDTTNAATGNINLDDADPADTKHYLAFDGIRHACLVDNTGNSKDAASAITLDLLNGQKARMLDTTYLMDWGHPIDPNDLVRVCDPTTADAIAMLDEVVTLDKYGPGATVLNGEQGRILGSPLVSSIAVSKTEADGKVSTTGSNNTKGQVVAFNRRGFVAGWRRQVRTEVERIPATDQTRLVHSLRLGFGRYSPTGAASGIEAADVIYDITL